MRVNFLITELRTGGAERCLTELAIGLHDRGDDVSVMSLMPLPKGSRDELVGRLREASIPIATTNAKGLLSLPQSTRQVRQWLASDLPDCLQTFLFHANVIGSVAARRAGVITVVGGVRVAEPNRWRSLIERRAVRGMRGIVCVSESVRKFASASLSPAPSVRLMTIRNGIRVERFRDATPLDWGAFGLAPEGRVILFLGRLHHQKGLDLLLDVAPSLLRLHPNWRLAIVGEGPLEKNVRKTIATLPEGQACLLPWQSDVARLYAAADVIISPSRYEGLPNVVLESMAAGRTVLAADVEGVAELLGPNAPAQTFPPGDRGSMVERLDQLLTSGDLNEIGEANRVRAEREFSIDRMVDSYRELYQQLTTTYISPAVSK